MVLVELVSMNNNATLFSFQPKTREEPNLAWLCRRRSQIPPKIATRVDRGCSKYSSVGESQSSLICYPNRMNDTVANKYEGGVVHEKLSLLSVEIYLESL